MAQGSLNDIPGLGGKDYPKGDLARRIKALKEGHGIVLPVVAHAALRLGLNQIEQSENPAALILSAAKPAEPAPQPAQS